MRIHTLTRQASVELLKRTRMGRLACAHEGQPYITPVNYAYDDNYLYSFSAVGQKITWMRANPLVCVEVEEVTTSQDWATVIVLGTYEELPDNPVHDMHRKHAYDLLQRRPLWWEPGTTPALEERAHAAHFTFFRIYIDQVSGRRAVPDAAPSAVEYKTRHQPAGWLRKIFRSGRMPKD